MPNKPTSGLTRRVREQVEPLQLEMKQITRTQSIFNENQVQKLFNSTPQRSKYMRPAKGGGQWTYLKTGYVRRVLDSIFGFNWDFDVETSVAEAFEIAKITKVCVVKGVVSGRVKVDGEWVEIRKVQFGRAEVKFKKDSTDPLDFGNDMKAAASDALKKCASLLGIGADVYDPEEFMAIEITGSEENDARKKQLKKQIRNARRAVHAAATKVGQQNDSAKRDEAKKAEQPRSAGDVQDSV